MMDTGISSILVGRLVCRLNKLKEFYSARETRYRKEKLNEKLFMGAGNRSIVLKNELHRRLEYATSQLSAIEQNGGMGHPFDERMDKECRQNIKDVIDDIIVAFNIG